MWAWTLWKTAVKIPKNGNTFEAQYPSILCKANICNTQPETPGALWNVRGLLNNSWHRVTLNIVD
jgi:sulfite oxidase